MIFIRKAVVSDVDQISEVLLEAARWLEANRMPLWKGDELSATQIAADVASDQFHVAIRDGEIAGTIKFQLEDPLFWPDVPAGEAAFIHRLAVRRKFSGGKISSNLLHWAIDRARQLGKQFLRLDCEAARTRLRTIYERAGFRHHSDRQVGPYFVARYEYDLLNRTKLT